MFWVVVNVGMGNGSLNTDCQDVIEPPGTLLHSLGGSIGGSIGGSGGSGGSTGGSGHVGQGLSAKTALICSGVSSIVVAHTGLQNKISRINLMTIPKWDGFPRPG